MADGGTLKPGWTKVKFGEVVRLCKDRSSDPEADGIERYVGLEHLEPEDLRIRRWGLVADGTTFTSRFKPGQVLFGKRRAYQRKVAIADFEGICSGDIYVFESANPKYLLPGLLPFICQADSFFEYAIGTSAGSLSPRTNWKSLKDFKFVLPPLEEQSKLLCLFQATESALEKRRDFTEQAFYLFRATVDAMFSGSFRERTGKESKKHKTDIGLTPVDWEVAKLSEVTTKIVDGVHKRPNYVSEGIPFLTVENLTRGPGIDFSETRFITQEDHEQYVKRANPEIGDVLVSKDGTLGIARVIDEPKEFSIFVSLALLKPDSNILDSWFLRYYFESSLFLRKLASKTSGSALKHIHLIDFRQTLIPLPNKLEQSSISEKIKLIDFSYRKSQEKQIETQYLKRQILNHTLKGGVHV
jgi:type I restriction enzyme S subunit